MVAHTEEEQIKSDQLIKELDCNAYACVYKPHIPCNDKQLNPSKTYNSKGKVFIGSHNLFQEETLKKKETLDIEWTMFNLIETRRNDIKQLQEFMYVPITSCITSTEKKSQLIFLESEIKRTILLRKIDKGGQEEDVFLLYVFRDLGNLFEGLQIMKEMKLVHMDIKSENILVFLEKKQISKIKFNFGLILDSEKIYKPPYKIKKLSRYYPPEFVIFASEYKMILGESRESRQVYLDFTEQLQKSLYDLLNKNSSITKDSIFYKLIMTTIENIGKQALKIVKNDKNYPENYNDPDKFAVFSLGITIFELLLKLTKGNVFVSKTRSKSNSPLENKYELYYRMILKLISGMISFDPTNRTSPELAFLEFEFCKEILLYLTDKEIRNCLQVNAECRWPTSQTL